MLYLIETKTNIRPYSNSIYFGNNIERNKHNGLIKELYDNNLYEIIQKNYFYITLEYISEFNLEYIKTNDLLADFSEEKVLLINYKSLESYNKELSADNYIFGSFSETSIIENAINIESAYIIDYDVNKYYKFVISSLNDIYYYNNLENNSDINNVNLSYTTIADVSNWVGRGAYKNVKQISDAYLVEGNYSNLYIYVPISKIKNYDIDNIDVGIECHGKFNTEPGEIVGDYFVSKLYLNSCDKNYDTKFTLLYSTYEK